MDKKETIALIGLYGIENSAIRSLSAILRANGFACNIVFLKSWVNNSIRPPTREEVRLLVQTLKGTNCRIVGFSVPSSYYKVAVVLTQIIHKQLDCLVVWGGLHPTLAPEECIPFADVIVRGEGELPLLELTQKYFHKRKIESITKVMNTWVRIEQKVYQNPLRPLIEDLDSLPFRDFSGDNVYFIDNNSVSRQDPIFTGAVHRIYLSRGCPFNCSYCYNSSLRKIYRKLGKYWRVRSPENCIEELKLIKRRFKKLRKIILDDDTLPSEPGWIKRFCRLYRQEIGIPISCLLNPEMVTEELITTLKEAGLVRVQMGIQSGSSREINMYGRGHQTDRVLQCARLLNKHQIEVVYDIIVDNPLADESDHKAMFELLLKLPRPFDIFLYSLNFFPKTRFTQECLEKGIISENDVIGRSTKTWRQFRVSFNYPRNSDELFWISLYVLSSKTFFPVFFLKWMAGKKFFRKNPKLIAFIAQVSNLIKMTFIALKLWRQGELTRFKIKQYSKFSEMLLQ